MVCSFVKVFHFGSYWQDVRHSSMNIMIPKAFSLVIKCEKHQCPRMHFCVTKC